MKELVVLMCMEFKKNDDNGLNLLLFVSGRKGCSFVVVVVMTLFFTRECQGALTIMRFVCLRRPVRGQDCFKLHNTLHRQMNRRGTV